VAPFTRLMRCGLRRLRRRDRAHRLVQAVDAAQAAARATGKGAPPLLEARHALRRDVETHLDAAPDRLDFDVVDFRRTFHDAFGEREAAGEVLEIARCGHHHRVADAVVDQRHRHFLRDDFIQRLFARSRQSPCRAVNGALVRHRALSWTRTK
jgi:hypothetical protein